MKCLLDESHDAVKQWITAVNAANYRHTLQVLHCPTCNKSWLPSRKTDGTEGVVSLDMNVWAKSLGPDVDVPGRVAEPLDVRLPDDFGQIVRLRSP